MHKCVLTIDWNGTAWSGTVTPRKARTPFDALELRNNAKGPAVLVWFRQSGTLGVKAVGLDPGGRVTLKILSSNPGTNFCFTKLPARMWPRPIGPTTIPPGSHSQGPAPGLTP